jgi:tetratricopeptide (TPR) repeat protein
VIIDSYANGFIANVQRVANEFDHADGTFRKAWDLWKAGPAVDFDPLAEWRLLSLEASLRRAQHRFSESLDLLDRARDTCDESPAGIGRILMKKSHVLEQQEDFAGALASLQEATPMIEVSGDHHLLFGLRFDTVANLRHLQRYVEAETLLKDVRELAVQQASELSLTRVTWLGANIASGLGRMEEAMAALEQVRGDFAARELPYEAALSSLDLAVLWLAVGRTSQVKALAFGMGWIFKAKGIDQKALAALTLFCEAARQETATVELTRQIIADIEAARRLRSPRRVEG